MTQAGLTEYPVGKTYVYDIGVAIVEQHYLSDRQMRYKNLTGEHAGEEETVAIDIKFIRPGVFLTSWQEASRITVVHLEDFDAGIFHSHVTMPDSSFRRFTSKMHLKP